MDISSFSQHYANYNLVLEHTREQITQERSEHHAQVLYRTTWQISELKRFYESRIILISELLSPSLGSFSLDQYPSRSHKASALSHNTQILFHRMKYHIQHRILSEIKRSLLDTEAQCRLVNPLLSRLLAKAKSQLVEPNRSHYAGSRPPIAQSAARRFL